MTIDATLITSDELAADLPDDMAGQEQHVAEAQLAMAAEATRVTLPQGQRVIVVPVQPGEIVELPTDTEQDLLAEIGPQGNLAFVLDGRTIILQGYVDANERSPVTVLTDDGDRVDVAAVVAETDPSLEIQTAAGPAAGPQGNAAATGSGIFVPFPVGAELGGLNAEGVLGGTALAYKLITNETKILDLGEEGGAAGGIGGGGGGGITSSVPVANPDSATVTQAVATDYQLMLVIDVSTSMTEQVTQPDGTVTTRMDLQKAAAIALLESYVASTSGSVNVKLVNFGNNAVYFGGTDQSTFVNVSDQSTLANVIAAINALEPTFDKNSNTDYDSALATAQLGIMDSSWATSDATTKGLVYFFSDGKPQEDGDWVHGFYPDPASPYAGGDKTNALNQTEENAWEGRVPAGAFTQGLAQKEVVSIAVGLGDDVANNPTALQQLGRVAYYNESFPDQSVIIVDDENQLVSEIIKTVPATVTGNVLTNDDPGADDFGSPRITAVSASSTPTQR